MKRLRNLGRGLVVTVATMTRAATSPDAPPTSREEYGDLSASVLFTYTASFSFNLLGVGMMGLTESSFLNLLSNDPGRPNEDTEYFVGRFQRVGPRGAFSDIATPTGPPTSSVPSRRR